jgi:hypothetical protein
MKSWNGWFNTQPKHHQYKESTGRQSYEEGR